MSDFDFRMRSNSVCLALNGIGYMEVYAFAFAAEDVFRYHQHTNAAFVSQPRLETTKAAAPRTLTLSRYNTITWRIDGLGNMVLQGTLTDMGTLSDERFKRTITTGRGLSSPVLYESSVEEHQNIGLRKVQWADCPRSRKKVAAMSCIPPQLIQECAARQLFPFSGQRAEQNQR
jgi:hypothetical protein